MSINRKAAIKEELALVAIGVLIGVLIALAFLAMFSSTPPADRDTYEATRHGFYLGCLNENNVKENEKMCEMKALYNYPEIGK